MNKIYFINNIERYIPTLVLKLSLFVECEHRMIKVNLYYQGTRNDIY